MADVEFIDNTMKVNRAIEDAVGAFLLEASGEIASEAARNTSVDTGQLKGSWKANVDESKGEATIGSGLENAIWNELGTGEWAANKDGRKNPWYIPVDGYNGKKKPTFNGKVVVVYGKHGKAFYKTNGKRPQHTLQKAFNDRKTAIIKRAEQIFKAKLGE